MISLISDSACNNEKYGGQYCVTHGQSTLSISTAGHLGLSIQEERQLSIVAHCVYGSLRDYIFRVHITNLPYLSFLAKFRLVLAL